MSKEAERIAKRIARAGVCSRREAEKLIEAGKVKVNGKVIKSAALNVSDSDIVHVNGKALNAKEPTRLWLYHKPDGLVTTHKDPEGRRTVFDALREQLPRVISVGRLDLNSEGLLLLTNDGALARYLELPATGWARRYRVRVFGTPTEAHLARMRKGMVVEGMRYGPMEVNVDGPEGKKGAQRRDPVINPPHGASGGQAPEAKEKSNRWVSVTLREGKNREIRKVFAALGFKVSRLLRVAYGPFQLGTMARGDIKEVPRKMLMEQLGKNFPLQ